MQTSEIVAVLQTAQSQSIENLSATAQRLQAALGKPDAMTESVAAMKAWLEQQGKINEAMLSGVQNQVFGDQSPAFVSNWLKMQEQFSQSWAETLRNLTGSISGTKVLEFYEHTANRVFGEWKKAYDQFAGMFSTTFGLQTYNPAEQMKAMHEQFLNQAKSYVQQLEAQISAATQSQA